MPQHILQVNSNSGSDPEILILACFCPVSGCTGFRDRRLERWCKDAQGSKAGHGGFSTGGDGTVLRPAITSSNSVQLPNRRYWVMIEMCWNIALWVPTTVRACCYSSCSMSHLPCMAKARRLSVTSTVDNVSWPCPKLCDRL